MFHFEALAQNKTISSYNKAKKILKALYGDEGRTFYCNCSYNKTTIDTKDCGVEVSKHHKRLKNLEWEHIVPASRFGQNFIEWVKGHESCFKQKRSSNNSEVPTKIPYKGRKCARRASKGFNKMEADLYNLRPSVGAINGFRNNFNFVEGLHILTPQFGKCDLKIIDKQIEPSNMVKGDVARSYLYMAYAYPGKIILTKEEKEMFEMWNKLDPVSKDECNMGKKIARAQKNTNPFIENECKKLYPDLD